jgi:hypothetical protein
MWACLWVHVYVCACVRLRMWVHQSLAHARARRWMNFHLKAAGSTRSVTNFGKDLADSEVFALVLAQINPAVCPPAPVMAEADLLKRARLVIDSAKALGVPAFIQPLNVTTCNKRLCLAFAAQIFNTNPGCGAAPRAPACAVVSVCVCGRVFVVVCACVFAHVFLCA